MAILDRPRWKAYLLVLVLGGMIGSPALLQNFLTKARYGDEWLTRNEFFTHRANPVFWMHGKLFVVYALGAAYVWFLRRTLLPVWLAGPQPSPTPSSITSPESTSNPPIGSSSLPPWASCCFSMPAPMHGNAGLPTADW